MKYANFDDVSYRTIEILDENEPKGSSALIH